jgi:1,4-alpha-glucan branching enzyme
MKDFIFILIFFICGIIGCMGAYSSSHQAAPQAITFHYKGSGQTVCITGDFNQWQTDTHCMRKNGDLWSITVVLFHGAAHYAFVVDDRQWVMDPNALYVEKDGFGRLNSVIMVE